MANRDFEVQQLLKAYRKGLITDALFEQQMRDVGAAATDGAMGGLDVANVLAQRGDTTKVSAQMLQKTPQSQTMAFTIPANFSNDHENTHKGDQIIYVVDGSAVARVSGKEQEIKPGDLLMIPAGAPHTLRTGSQPFFGFTIFAPPEERMG
jgi:quercetin dioxygenase-like cupin family protein